MQDKPLSRRGILSTVSSMFDPLGLVSPFILVEKQILQELCGDGVGWDDEVPDKLRPKWEEWRTELPALERLRVARCHKHQDVDEVKNAELHHFSDACQNCYGQCSYIPLVDVKNRVHCSLVMGKSRVTPLQPVTHTQTRTNCCCRLIEDQLYAAEGAGVCADERSLLDR